MSVRCLKKERAAILTAPHAGRMLCTSYDAFPEYIPKRLKTTFKGGHVRALGPGANKDDRFRSSTRAVVRLRSTRGLVNLVSWWRMPNRTAAMADPGTRR